MKSDHDAAVKAYKNHHHGAFHLILDLQTLSPVTFANESLSRIVLEKTSLGAKGLAAVVALSDATNDLKFSMDFRNNLIAEFQKSPPATHEDRLAFYLGVQSSTDTTDQRFRGNIAALSHQIDDCIFFGMLLADELIDYGNSLWRRNRWKYRLGIAKMLPADWTAAKEANLIPAKRQFANWIGGFKTSPSRWHRFRSWLSGRGKK